MSASWKIRGPDTASETHYHMAAQSSRMSQVFNELRSGWMLQVDAIRSSSPGYSPRGDFPDPATRIIDEERRQQFLSQGEHYETEHFLTATYLPPATAERRMRLWLYEGQPPGEKGDARQALDDFEHAISSLEDRLRSLVHVTRLRSQPKKDRFGVETVYDEQLRFMRRSITGIDHPFALPDIPFYLNDILCPHDLVGGLRPRLGQAADAVHQHIADELSPPER